MKSDIKPWGARHFLVLAFYFLLSLTLGVLMRDIRFDDPFITYRFADNVANGLGFIFNPGDASNPLITTAPLYALLLAVPGALGFDIPAGSFVIGVAALVVAAWTLFTLGLRRGYAMVGFVAGLLLLIFPLTWLTLGFETPLFIAVALLTFLCIDTHRFVLAGILTAIALGLRGDGAIVLVLAAMFSVEIKNAKPSLKSLIFSPFALRLSLRVLRASFQSSIKLIAAALIVYAPLAFFLTLQFGSPIPTTLQTKSAQAASGLTGFYPNTTFPEGGLILIRAYLEQSPLFAVVLIAVALGLVCLVQLSIRAARGESRKWYRCVPFLIPVVWAVLHFAGYTLIHVAPYVWYYAPMLPGVVCLAALGVHWVASFVQRKALIALVAMMLLLIPLAVGDANIVRVLGGATPPPPSEITSKVLPETKVNVYERVGRWLNANTPKGASVSVTELGVMGYYAQRHINDFLGLTRPKHLDAIRRGDYVSTLIREQPDYLALTNINSLYDANPQEDDWFRAIYTSVAIFEDPRFWGSPMTVWQRTTQPVTPSIVIDEGVHDLGDDWKVTGIAVSSREVVTNTPLIVSVRLQAGQKEGNRELRIQPIVIQRGDGLPVRSRVIHTDQFRPNEEAWYDFPMMPYPNARKGAYEISVKWLDSERGVIAGRIKVPLHEPKRAYAQVTPLSSGIGVELLNESITACIGATTTITVNWRGGDTVSVDYNAFVHLRDEVGNVIAQHDGQPRNGTYPTSVWSKGEVVSDGHAIEIPSDAVPGSYSVVVGLYNPTDNARLPVDDSPFRTSDGAVRIGEMIVMSCS